LIIRIELIEESHTSKCSFLDGEPIAHHEKYLGQRGVYRSKKAGGNGKVSYGLFKTATGQIINADVNGAYNILRKAFPKFSKDGIEGLELVPIAVKFSRETQDFTQLKQLANLISSTADLSKANHVGVGGVRRSTTRNAGVKRIPSDTRWTRIG
jgi:putative transposase